MQRILVTCLTVLTLVATIIASQFGFAPPAKLQQESPVPRHALGAIQPRLSPDGKAITFSYHGSIWRMPLAPDSKTGGGEVIRLTDGEGFDIEPVFSPDGKRIAYVNSPNAGRGRLKLIDAENGKSIELPKPVQVNGTIIYYKLYFHADGRRVLGVFRSEGTDRGLAWFDLETGRITTIVKPPRWSRYALSNDGKSIAYTETMDVAGQQSGNDGPQADIWTVPAGGGDPVKITRFPSRIHDLCWSADDRALYVVTDLGGVYYDLWHVPLDDPVRSAKQITFGQADEHRPSVSRDGRWLLFTDNRNSSTSLVLRDLTTGLDRTLTVSRINFRSPTGSVRLTTLDRKTGKPVVARVSIQQEGGKYYTPAGSLHRVLKNYGHFYCDRKSELTLPAGKYQLRALRGPEYRVARREFEVKSGQTVKLTIELDRWIHAAARGWYSGENHIHANYGYGEWYNTPETMLQQCSGEDLNVCNFMVANSDTNGVFDRQFFRGRPDPLSTDSTILYWNQEFRATIWGHMTLVNLKQVVEPVFTGFKDTTNPWDIPTNSDVADRTHWQNGLVNYTHVAQNPDDPYVNPYTGKGIPIDVALGKIDSLDINNSYRGTLVLWYRLLNCGFRLPASAGTDCFLNRIRSRLPGGDRVYVKVAGPFSYDGWIKGLRAGRSFVTNGPMLEFSVNGQDIGKSIRLHAPGNVHVVGKASSQFPMSLVELIYNGRVVATARLSDDKLQAVIDKRVKLDRSGWLALRASGPGHIDLPLGSQNAHTSPIYVSIANKPAGSRKDAESFLKWIDRLELAIRVRGRIPNEQLKQHVRSQFEAARAVYSQIAERSQ